MSEKQRVLITGGAGFIGSHLAGHLLDDGYRVIVMDNLLTGDIRNVSRFANRDFLFIKHDVTEYMIVGEPVDYVLHFASPASPTDYLRYPIHTLKVGAMGTHKALGLAKYHDATFVLASTSEVYGDPEVNPQPETYWGQVNPIGPRGVYDEAKRFAEAMTMAYRRSHGLSTRIVRIFNTYGPRMRLQDGRAIPNFITQALRGEPLTIYGDGSQTRSFSYIEDTVRGILALMHSDRWPRRCSTLPGAIAKSWRCRFRKTTHRSAAPTSTVPRRSWAGRPRCRSYGQRSTGSAKSSRQPMQINHHGGQSPRVYCGRHGVIT